MLESGTGDGEGLADRMLVSDTDGVERIVSAAVCASKFCWVSSVSEI